MSMLFQLDDALLALQQEAREFARTEVAPQAARRDREKEFPADLMTQVGARGWLGCLVPRSWGGSDIGNIGQAVVLEEIAAACASTHVTMSVHNSLMSTPLKKYASAELQQEFLPKVVTGEWLGAYLLTEPGAGSDAAAQKTTAVRDGDDWLINGEKMWITTGDMARVGIVFARTDLDPAARDAKAVSAFVVDMQSPGISFGKREPKLGLRGSTTVAISLKDLRVPGKNLLGELHRGFNIAMDLLNGGRIGIAIQGIGIGRAALELALDTVGGLKRNGKDLARSQSVQFRLADMATRVDAARLLAYRAAELRDHDLPHIKEASMAKLFATRMANEVCREVVELLGESGYGAASAAERLMRDCRICELYEGTTEIQKLVIAKQLFADRAAEEKA
ncbi:MAG: acyl-CoA dehydrogenase family protein [Planctomycetes bacterium]|nr:acyl-CoA dehydrogenase family protein [Planctomycetota bacterium]